MTVHVALLQLVDVNSLGAVVDKSAASTTIKNALMLSKDWRVMPDSTNPSTGTPPGDYPTLTTYLEREAAAGYQLTYMNQTTIVTYQFT